MNIEEYRDYCLAKPGTSEAMPFDDNALVFKVGGKIFSITGVNEFEYMNLKCDPEKAVELRADHPGIRPGFHMNKKHWNSVYHRELMNDPLVFELVDHSYTLILSSLPKKRQEEIRLEAGRTNFTP